MNCGPIMIVDGDAEARDVAAGILRRAGFASHELERGEDAFEAATRELPALVLLEVVLPGLSGYEICRELREQFGEALPIILMSAEKTDSIDQVAGLLLGGDDYIAKPFAPEILLARVRRLVERSAVRATGAESTLTRREREVLSLLVAAKSRRDIARELVITVATVGKHIEHILVKLGVHSQTQAIAVAARDGLVDVPVGRPLERSPSG